jgi:riboflavin kinase/FMN adenylyltransferase
MAHQALINKAEALVVIERNGGYLTPGYKRTFFTNKVCCFYHFDVIKGLTPKEFVQKLQNDFPNLKTIVVGYDFAFGKNRAGNAKILQELFSSEVKIVKEISIDGISVHSRVIKQYLKEGDIKMANRLLGREHSIEGRVISGQGIGKKELVPTLNLNIKEYQLPKEGVYATRTKIKDEWLASVTFLGNRVTTDGSFAIESHVIGCDVGEVKGRVEIKFVDFLRENRKFETLEELKVQIEKDIAVVKESIC